MYTKPQKTSLGHYRLCFGFVNIILGCGMIYYERGQMQLVGAYLIVSTLFLWSMEGKVENQKIKKQIEERNAQNKDSSDDD